MTTLILTPGQQTQARARAVQAARLALAHEPDVHYTMGPQRWEAINDRRDASAGEYPSYADCSAFVTWCIWNGVYLPWGMEDIVNGAGWAAGYTGTMLAHGTPVAAGDLLPGDAVIYGPAGSTGEHTAIVWQAGAVARVISHGQEGGPYDWPYNYRSDVQAFRRYIDGRPHQATGGPAPAPPPAPAPVASMFTVVKADGRLECFTEDTTGNVWHAWQTAPNGGWAGAAAGDRNAGWQSLGNPGA